MGHAVELRRKESLLKRTPRASRGHLKHYSSSSRAFREGLKHYRRISRSSRERLKHYRRSSRASRGGLKHYRRSSIASRESLKHYRSSSRQSRGCIKHDRSSFRTPRGHRKGLPKVHLVARRSRGAISKHNFNTNLQLRGRVGFPRIWHCVSGGGCDDGGLMTAEVSQPPKTRQA